MLNERKEKMPIPKTFTDRYLKEAEGCNFFSIPIQELTRNELIACAIAGWKRESDARAEGIRMVKFMRDIHKT